MARAEIFYGYSWKSPEEFGLTTDDFHALYAWEDEQEELGASMGDHSGDDDSIACPHLQATAAPHWWVHDYGRGEPIEPSKLSYIDPAWKPALDRYLAAHGIEPPQGENQPGWWVVANGHI